jgi:hypothetical protein
MTGRSHPNAPATGGKVPKFLVNDQASADLIVKSRAPNTINLFAARARTFEGLASEFRRDSGPNPSHDTPTQVHSTFSKIHKSCFLLTFLAMGLMRACVSR